MGCIFPLYNPLLNQLYFIEHMPGAGENNLLTLFKLKASPGKYNWLSLNFQRGHNCTRIKT